MHLAQYLAAGEPAGNGGQGGSLKAVDMREFGFHGVPEMMDLVCAVRCLFSFSWEEIGLMHWVVRDECVHVVFAVSHACWGGYFAPSGDV